MSCISRTNVASVGSAFNDTRKVKVLSLPETIKEKTTFRAKPFVGKRTFTLGVSRRREPLPFAYRVGENLYLLRINVLYTRIFVLIML